MPLVALLLVLFTILLAIALVPVSIVQRYRVGSARQRARSWLATLNVAGLTISILVFLAGAAFTSIWVDDALVYPLAGLASGGLLGVIGLALTRWESSPGAVHFTQNRWLLLSITLIVTARLGYGLWRGWQASGAALDGTTWADQAGVAGSLGAGAIVLGYYWTFWIGVRRRVRAGELPSQPR